ncbi:arsenate reductase family protein [Mongoliibacter ruber]|uniref:Arsenate reductase-like glutaredoxin family protein n=1 Tax=Mongoliibacter ruber TaxID=1750599 RepID=A0A2T0WJU2_9BACT|nr:hypothetical protein [Mongoliibacter ruber]PRY86978.1 arsenate reductase-like glutaredoxin family protein [Mongoliibacter ruber]
MFELEKNEIKFLYNGNNQKDKEAYAYVLTLHKHKINELDVSKNDLTPTQLVELAAKMKMRIIDLFDKKSDYFKENIEGNEIEEEDLLDILIKEKSALKTPIIISKGIIKIIDYPRDTINLDMTFK